MRDYDELVKALRICEDGEHCDLCPKWDDKQNGGMNVCQTALCKEAADAIEELLAAVPKWISVEERLPEIGEFVLVSDGQDIDTACRYRAITIQSEEVGFVSFCETIWDTIFEVTHWMPLPDPPKEVV